MNATETEILFFTFNRLKFDYSITNSKLVIRVNKKQKAREVVQNYKSIISRITQLFCCNTALVFYPESNDPFEIPTMSHKPLKIEQKLWMIDEFRALSIDYIKIAERMTQSSCPMILTRMSDNRLIWTNDKHIEVTRQAPEQVIQQRMGDYWKPADLAELHKRLRQDGNFFHRYQCRVIGDEWERFYSRFELLFDGLYRLATIHEHEPLISV